MEITGRLVANATVRTTGDNKKVTGFSVAVNRRYKSNGEQKEETTYFDCSYWRTDKIAPYLTKGLVVHLTGNVSANAWVSRDGELMASLRFHTNEINFLGASSKPYSDGAKSTLRRQS